jgi:flavin reductase (DIM6/NTAB) family NADH-FMN oxidoreductase RutF
MQSEMAKDPTQWFPMPAALVTTLSPEGEANLMGIGYVGFMCWQPPVVCLGINTARHSGAVIKATREFVVALPEHADVLGMDFCGWVSGTQCDKFRLAGFTTRAGDRVRAPLINECAVNLECELFDLVPLGSHELYLGRVVATHVADDYLDGRRELVPVILVSRRYMAASEFLHDFGASAGNPPRG